MLFWTILFIAAYVLMLVPGSGICIRYLRATVQRSSWVRIVLAVTALSYFTICAQKQGTLFSPESLSVLIQRVMSGESEEELLRREPSAEEKISGALLARVSVLSGFMARPEKPTAELTFDSTNSWSSQNLALPFRMLVGTNHYSSVWVSAYGVLGFDAPQGEPVRPTVLQIDGNGTLRKWPLPKSKLSVSYELPSAKNPDAVMLAPLWGYHSFGDGSSVWMHDLTNSCVITYENIYVNGSETPTSFQMEFFRDGDMFIRYKELPQNIGSTHRMGFQNNHGGWTLPGECITSNTELYIRAFGWADPDLEDTDGDGLLDIDEIFEHHTRTDLWDTDGDLWGDFDELAMETCPRTAVPSAIDVEAWCSEFGVTSRTDARLFASPLQDGFSPWYVEHVLGGEVTEIDRETEAELYVNVYADRPAVLAVKNTNTLYMPIAPKLETQQFRLRLPLGIETKLTLQTRTPDLPETMDEGYWRPALSVEAYDNNCPVFASDATYHDVSASCGISYGEVSFEYPQTRALRKATTPDEDVPCPGGNWPSIPLMTYSLDVGVTPHDVCPLWTLSLQDGLCTWGSNAGTVNVYIDDRPVCTTSASSYNFNPAAYGGGKHTVVIRNAAYGWLVGRAAFEVGSHLPDGVETNLAACVGDDHTPGYSDNPTNSPCICKHRAKQPTMRFGFDHAKVNTRNLTHPKERESDKKYDHCLGIMWGRNGEIDLMSLVHEDALPYRTNALWRINGTLQDVSILRFQFKVPVDLEPHIYRIEIVAKEDREVWDRMFLVINHPASGTRYSRWANKWSDEMNRAWLQELPAPYVALPTEVDSSDKLIYHDPEPDAPDIWEVPGIPGLYYHHTSVRDMRSAGTSGGHGHQACYDETGNIVLNGVSAGTADYVKPKKTNVLTVSRHSDEDVLPYVRALQLDGNPCEQISAGMDLSHALVCEGPQTKKYLICRPPIPNNKPMLSPQIQ